MPNVMAARPNIGNALSESSVIPFLVPRRKVWLTPAAGVPCSNAANMPQDLDVKWILHLAKNSVRGKTPETILCSIPAQQTVKHRAKFGWFPLSDVAAVAKPRREPRWYLPGCPKPANRSRTIVGWSSPYCEGMWMRYCCLTSFFRLSLFQHGTTSDWTKIILKNFMVFLCFILTWNHVWNETNMHIHDAVVAANRSVCLL